MACQQVFKLLGKLTGTGQVFAEGGQQFLLQPIAVGIFNFQGTYNTTSTQVLAAASVLSIVPAVVTFLVLQRFIIGALTAGAVKG